MGISEKQQYVEFETLLEHFESSWNESSYLEIRSMADQVTTCSVTNAECKRQLLTLDLSLRMGRNCGVNISDYSDNLALDSDEIAFLYRELYSLLNLHSDEVIRISDYISRVPDNLVSRVARELPEPSRFKLVSLIGQGGMGYVYQAWDRELGRMVALKSLIHHGKSKNHEELLVREVKITASLEHPAVLPIYGYGKSSEGSYGYAMRLLACGSLPIHASTKVTTFAELIESVRSKVVSDWRCLEARDLLQRFRLVCSAIDYAHQKGIVHNDIKPHNILILGDETFVSDWGLADWIEQSSVPSEFQEYTTRFGSIDYMSPEKQSGQSATFKDDIYSLGATFHFLLTGTPHNIETSGHINRTIACPAALRAVCKQAMAKSPALRYESAMELSKEIERWLADGPVHAYRESIFNRLIRLSRRHSRNIVFGLFAMAGMLIVAFWFSYLLYLESNRATQSASRAVQAEKMQRELRIMSETNLEKAEHLQEVLLSSIRFSDPYGKFGPQLPMRQFLDQVRRSINERSDLSDDTKFETLLALGEMNSSLNSDKEAQDCLEAALRNIENRPESSPLELARVYFALGMLRLGTSELNFLEKARGLLETHVSTDHPLLARTIGEISWRKHLTNEQNSDTLMFASVVPILGGNVTIDEVRRMYYRYLSEIRKTWLEGKRIESQRIVREAAKPALNNELFSGLVPSALKAIAIKQVAQNNAVVAEPILREAIAICEDKMGHNKNYYELQFDLALYYFNQGRFNDANAVLQSLIGELSTKDVGTKLLLGYAYCLAAQLKENEAEDLPALSLYLQCLPLIEAVQGSHHRNTLFALRRVAALNNQMGEFKDTMQQLEPRLLRIDSQQASEAEIAELKAAYTLALHHVTLAENHYYQAFLATGELSLDDYEMPESTNALLTVVSAHVHINWKSKRVNSDNLSRAKKLIWVHESLPASMQSIIQTVLHPDL
jgi:serine/threonine protein kinase